MPGYHRQALIIKTWNAYVTNKTLKVLSYRDAENYPEFI
jgi:hypothetical protein